MCCSSGSCGETQFHLFLCKPRRPRLRLLLRPSRVRRNQREFEEIGKDIAAKNMKLFMENINIFEENEKLRKQACLLHQENLALLSQFHKRFHLNKKA